MTREVAVMLRHTAMTVPHTRLRVVALRERSAYNGVAFTADLHHDGVLVGTIDNDGNGGPTEVYSPNSLYGWQRMAEFVAGCLLDDAVPDESRVLDALVDEYRHDQYILAACRAGRHPVRRHDTESGYTLDLATTGSDDQAEILIWIRRQHPAQDDGTWQTWAATGWEPVSSSRPA